MQWQWTMHSLVPLYLFLLFSSSASSPTHLLKRGCQHSDGDPCKGDLNCCLNGKIIAECITPVYALHGTWSVYSCGGALTKCIGQGDEANCLWE